MCSRRWWLVPRAHDLHGVTADRLPSKSMGGPIPDFGWDRDWDDGT